MADRDQAAATSSASARERELEAEVKRLRGALERIAYNSDGELRSGRATALIAAEALSPGLSDLGTYEVGTSTRRQP